MRLFYCYENNTYFENPELAYDPIITHHGCNIGNGEIFLMGVATIFIFAALLGILALLFMLIPIIIYQECNNKYEIQCTFKNAKKAWKFIGESLWNHKKPISITIICILAAISFIWLIGYNVSLI